MKRLVIFVILFSMIFHCASRIGLLSLLYQHRHQIAYTLGLISEVPIAMCNSDHDFNQGLVIQEHEESDITFPPRIFQTQEIQLFCNGFLDLSIDPNHSISMIDRQSIVVDHAYKTPALSIFHPPS